MMLNSELAVNTHFYSEPFASSAKEARVSNVKPFPLTAQVSAVRLDRKPISYKMLALVTILHMVALAGVLSAKPEQVQVVNKLETPMMVSLVTQVADEPKELPKPPVEQVKPVQKQVVQKPKVVKKVVVNEEAARKIEPVEPVVAEQTEAEVVAESKPVESQPVAKAAEVAPPAAPEKVAAEPVIEPPSFGAAYLKNPAPTYPTQARRMGEQGRVLLKVLVSVDGKAETVKVDTSSGHQKLDQAAIDAVKKWSFIPAKRSNQPISAYVLVPVNFTLS